MDTEQSALLQSNEVQMVEKEESKRKKAAKAQIQNYFLMLTEGCGDSTCTNLEHCSTASPDVKLKPNEAAIRAVALLKSKAPLCQKYRNKQGGAKRRAPAKKNRANNRRQGSPMDVDVTPTNSNPPNNSLSDSYSSRAQASDGAARSTRQVGRWESVDRRETGEATVLDSGEADPYTGAEEPLPLPLPLSLDFLLPHLGAGQHSDSDRESEGAPTGSSGEGSSADLGITEAMIRNLISGFSMERGLEAEGTSKQRRSRKTKYKEHRLASLDEISQFPFLDEEKLTHLLSNPNSNSDTEQSISPASNSEVNKILSSVFSNPYALSKSFLKRIQLPLHQTEEEGHSSPPSSSPASSKQKILPAIGVDVDSVARSFSLICSLEDDKLEECLSRSLHKMGKELYRINVELHRSSRTSMTQPFHLLNVYVILMECPLLATPRFLYHGFPYFSHAVAALGSHDQEELVVWYASYSDEDLLKFVQTFQQLITYRILDRTLDNEDYEIHSDEVVEVAVKSLRLFYLASLLSAKNKGYTRPYQLSNDQENRLTPMSIDPIIERFGIYPNSITKPTIPFEDFYNDSLNSVIDVHDIERALVNLSSSRKFSFLRYSFVLNAATKVLKLFCDNKFEMIEERRRTVFNIIFSGGHDTPFLNLQVNRNTLLLDTLGNIEAVADMDPNMFKKQLRIKFEGEDGLDEGGPQKEFFQLLIEELFNPDFGMFYVLDNGVDYWFNMFSFENEANFRLIGILFGLAIYNSIILDVHFPMTVYRKLLNCTPTYDDLHASHPQMSRGFEDLLSYEGEELEEDYMLTFNISYTGQFGETVSYDLRENGEDIPVTKENRKSYVELYSDWLLNKSIETQFTAFKAGFDLVVKSNPLDEMFTAEEVELLICGSQDFDFKELQKTASYEGFTQTQKLMIDFWDVVHNFPEERKRQLLQFITGTDRVPVGGLSQIKLIIVRNGPDSDRLPSAHTCFNALLLPNYLTKEKLKERLLKALKFGKGFGMI